MLICLYKIFPCISMFVFQKPTQWVSSAFDGFGDFEAPVEKTQKPRSQTDKSRFNGTTDKPPQIRRDNKIQSSGIKRSFESLQQGESSKRSAENFKGEEATTRSFENWKQRETTRNQSVFSSRKTVSRRANKLPETDLWSDKYTPKSQVVNKRYK